MRIRCTLTTEEGEVLDTFYVQETTAQTPGQFAHEVRDTIEMKHDTSDE
jgi:hypothetical protein